MIQGSHQAAVLAVPRASSNNAILHRASYVGHSMSNDASAQSTREEVQRAIRRIKAQQKQQGYDPFGFNPAFLDSVLPLAATLYRAYFRVITRGIEHIPDGRALLIANHSGQIPLDGLMIATSQVLDRDPPKMTRAMVEKWVPTLPFVSMLFSRGGQVVGTPANARLLLERGEQIMAFPEGARGISKTWNKRYQLEEFGLGFMRLALQTQTPIVPIGVVGAEEQIPTLYNARKLAKVLGLPSLPIALTPLVPLPVRYRIYFGQPLTFQGDPDDEDRVIRAKVHVVRRHIEDLIAEGRADRPSLFE